MMDAEHMMEQRAIYASLQQRNNKRRRSEYGEDRVHRQRTTSYDNCNGNWSRFTNARTHLTPNMAHGNMRGPHI